MPRTSMNTPDKHGQKNLGFFLQCNGETDSQSVPVTYVMATVNSYIKHNVYMMLVCLSNFLLKQLTVRRVKYIIICHLASHFIILWYTFYVCCWLLIDLAFM